MTRAEVARTIDRSIATVRRMEGQELHPNVGADGVHHFDPTEVEAVAEDLRLYGRRREEHAHEQPSFILESQLQSARSENEHLKAENLRLRDENDLAAEVFSLAAEAVRAARSARSPDAWLLQSKLDVFVSVLSGH